LWELVRGGVTVKVVYAFFARYAEPNKDSSWNLIGADFDKIKVTEFPTVIPTLSFVLKINFEDNEKPEHFRAKFKIEGPKGEILADSGNDWTIARRLADESTPSDSMRMVFGTTGLQLNEAGLCTLTAEVENFPPISASFEAVLIATKGLS
jgi:hypothetical protein